MLLWKLFPHMIHLEKRKYPLKYGKIGQVIKEKDENSKEIYQEADVWLNDVFKEYECITILGI